LQCSLYVPITLDAETIAMPDDADLPARYANGRFGPGNPGRPVGSYNRASRRAALAILDHFDSIQGGFLEKLADGNRDQYIALLAKVLPRQIEVGSSVAEFLPEAELSQAYAAACGLLDDQGDRRSAVAELEAILLGEPAYRRLMGHR
jgi:hypothetical protein